jgi:hypothetical protein
MKPADDADPSTPDAAVSDHCPLDAAYYEDLAGRLYGLLIGLEDRLGREDARQLHHFIDVGEYRLALEEIAAALADATVPYHRSGAQRHADPDRHHKHG